MHKGDLKRCQCGCNGWLKLHLLIKSSVADFKRDHLPEDEEDDFVYDEDNVGNEEGAAAQCHDEEEERQR